MNISPDDLLLLLGSKEAELFLTRKQLAAAAADLDRVTAALKAADAELAALKATPPGGNP